MNSQIKRIADMYIATHPQLQECIIDLAQLADAEVEDGESLENEVELMVGDIQDLVNE